MLRGQGSLKELLGQSVVASSYARKKRLKAEADAAAAAAAQPAERTAKRARPASSKAAPPGTDAAADAAAKLFAKAKTAASALQQQASDLARVRPDPPDAATPLHLDSNGAAAGINTPADRSRSGADASAAGQQPGSARGAAGAGSTPICCPICSRALSESSDAINSHIGELCSALSNKGMQPRSRPAWPACCMQQSPMSMTNPLTADHCLARSASAKRVKQRTVTALFGFASAAAAQRCRAMVKDTNVKQQAALRSTSAPPEMQQQPQQPKQQPRKQSRQQSQDAEVTLRQRAHPQAVTTHAAALAALQTLKGLPEAAAAANGHATANGHVTEAAAQPAVTESLPDLLDQPTQPLDAMLHLRQQHDSAHAAASNGSLPNMASQPNAASAEPAASSAGAAGPFVQGRLPLGPVPMETDFPAAAAPEHTAVEPADSQDEPGMRTPQRQIISRQTVLPCASPLATVKSFTTCVVGRRFQTEAECVALWPAVGPCDGQCFLCINLLNACMLPKLEKVYMT